MVVDGKQIMGEILRAVRAGVDALDRAPIVRAVAVNPTPATESYLRIKSRKAEAAGMRLEVVRLGTEAGDDEVTTAITTPAADAVIVQLPLPARIDTQRALDAIPEAWDADMLSGAAYARFLAAEPGALLPPVVGAVAEILARAGIDPAGKHAVVVGNGRLVGHPVAAWLTARGAAVTVLDKETFSAGAQALKAAEIVVSGVGSAHFLTPDLLAPDAVLIDAGTSESNGAIVGDFDPACADLASVFTPVPGGVGPITVACLFKNVLQLVRGDSVKEDLQASGNGVH